MNRTKHIAMRFLPALLALALACVSVPACSRAAPVTFRSAKDFRELIVKGERPEIAACMVAALHTARNSAQFEALRWTDDDSDAAILRETESNGHLLRSVHFKAQLRPRSHGFFTESWQASEVVCEQHDEQSPQVRLSVLAP